MSTQAHDQDDSQLGYGLSLGPQDRVFSLAEPMWWFILMFLAMFVVLEQVLPFPVEGGALYDMCCHVTGFLFGVVFVRYSWRVISQHYGRRLRAKRDISKSSFDEQKEFHLVPHDRNIRSILRWTNAFFIAEGIYSIIHWKPFYLAHHVISVIHITIGLFVEQSGACMVLGIFCGEVTNPVIQTVGIVRHSRLLLTDTAAIAYLTAVDQRFTTPTFIVLFAFFRLVVYPFVYYDHMLFYYRILSIIRPWARNRANLPDTVTNGSVEVKPPFLVYAAWAIVPVIIVSGSAEHVYENRADLVVPDPRALFGW